MAAPENGDSALEHFQIAFAITTSYFSPYEYQG